MHDPNEKAWAEVPEELQLFSIAQNALLDNLGSRFGVIPHECRERIREIETLDELKL